MSTDGTYVFTSDLVLDQVRRVRLNGSDASVWSVSGPYEVECDARNGLVYISSDGGVRVFDADGTGGSPLDILFEGPAGTAPGEAESVYDIVIHPVTGEIYVVYQRCGLDEEIG